MIGTAKQIISALFENPEYLVKVSDITRAKKETRKTKKLNLLYL